MRRRTKNGHKSKRFYLRHAVPAVVWVLAVTLVVWLFYQRSARFEVLGMARGQVRQVAVNSPGRIKKVCVDLFQSVKTGDVLAVVDTVTESEQGEEAKLKTEFAMAAAEVAVGLALVLRLYSQFRTLDADAASRMRG